MIMRPINPEMEICGTCPRFIVDKESVEELGCRGVCEKTGKSVHCIRCPCKSYVKADPKTLMLICRDGTSSHTG